MAHDPGIQGGRADRVADVLARAFGWGVLGAVCGGFLGFVSGIILAPPKVPGQPLAHEWYTVGVIIFMFIEAVAGFVVGVGIAVAGRSPTEREKAFGLALAWAAVGVGLNWVLARVFHVRLVNKADASELASGLLVQAIGVAVAMILTFSRPGAPASKGPKWDE